MHLIIGNIYQGRHDFARDKYGENITIMDDLEDRLRSGISPEEILREANQYEVCIATEGYGGLTQIDEEARRFSKLYGQMLIEIASKADSVERVVCGQGITIR